MKNKTYKANIWKTYIFRFLVSLHFMGGVLVPFFTDWGKINFAQILFLQSWFSLWVFLLEVPTGVIADKFGRKTSLLIGALVNIIAVIVYANVPNFYIFMLGEFLFAIACALFSGADNAIVYDSLKKIGEEKKATKILARTETFNLLGIMVAAPIGSFIAAKFGLQMPMMLMSIPLALAFLVSLTLKEPKNGYTKTESRKFLRIAKDSFKLLHKNKVLKILALDLIVISAVSYFMIWLYQPMLKQAGLPIQYFGWVHAALTLAQIGLMNNYGKLEKLFGSKKGIVFFSAAITGVMFIVGGLTKSLPLTLLVILVGGGFGLARDPLFFGCINKHLPSSKRATMWSSINMFRRVLLVIVNPLIGLLVDKSLNLALISLGAVALAFALFSRVEERHLED